MRRFSINTETKIPGDEFILKNKPPFENIASGTVPKMNPARRIWQWGGGTVITAAIVTAVVILSQQQSELPEPSETISGAAKCIQEPDPAAAIQPVQYHFLAENGAVFQTPTGTKIIIPENAFTDNNGAQVNGPVSMSFREFHNIPQIFLSGIPMQYDSAGEKYTFVSAGMFELLAFQNGKPLQVSNGKQLNVDLVSASNDPSHNLYYLDTLKNKWLYLGESSFESMPEVSKDDMITDDFTYAYQTENASIDREQMLIKPEKALNNAYLFKVNYNKAEFPELSAYSDVVFQVDENRQAFDPQLYKTTWTNVTVKHSTMQDLYLLKLSRPDTVVKLYAKPVFKAETYQQALAVYNKKVSEQQAKVNQQKKTTGVSDNASAKIQKTSVSAWQGYRTVPVTRTGVYNCDYPYRVTGREIQPSFTCDGAPFTPSKVFWTDKTVNAMFESDGQNVVIRFVKDAPIVLWVMNEQGKMAVINEQEFARATKRNDKPVFDVSFGDVREKTQELSNELYGSPANTYASNDIGNADAGLNASISCYPNPVSSVLNISIANNLRFTSSSLSILRSDGSLIETISLTSANELIQYNATPLSPGIYFCQLNLSGGNVITARFIRQ